MTEIIKKACELSKKLLDQINDYCGQYIGLDGKDVVSESSIMALQEILEEGFTLHNYLIEHKLFEGKPAIENNLLQLEDYMKRLAITKENAEKLKLSNAIQVWNQTKIAIAVLAGSVLDEYEEKAE
jgi:hypothetical protein